jgi:hypothetical protein
VKAVKNLRVMAPLIWLMGLLICNTNKGKLCTVLRRHSECDPDKFKPIRNAIST